MYAAPAAAPAITAPPTANAAGAHFAHVDVDALSDAAAVICGRARVGVVAAELSLPLKREYASETTVRAALAYSTALVALFLNTNG